MNDKLKPCPFCGGEAKVLCMTYSGGKVYGVFCKRDSEAEDQHGHFIDNYSSEEDAVSAWNRRAYNTAEACASYWNRRVNTCV